MNKKNDAQDPVENLLKTLAPSPPSKELRNRVAVELSVAPIHRHGWRLAGILSAVAAAAILYVAFGFEWAGMDNTESNKTGSLPGPLDQKLVLTFPIEEKAEPIMGNWNPYDIRYLVPHAEVVLYGKVERGTKVKIDFTVHKILRGDLKTLRLDTSQQEWRFGGCGPRLAEWPVGEFCCIYLKYDAKERIYKFVDTGVPIQRMPYRDVIDLTCLSELIRVWDVEFAGKNLKQQQEHLAKLGEHEHLVYELVQSGNSSNPDEYREKAKRLVGFLNDKGKKDGNDLNESQK